MTGPSRSFAILLREARCRTPDPERPGKCLTQERLAEICGIALESVRRYEQDRHLPHPIILRELKRVLPIFTTPE